ncbi:hypothetical protein N2384_00250 [Bacillus paralicheniformis]|nr:hypothetical protein [Bacillus paralicheniformis]UWS61853.1 hypothetical protein N2384_00250 [Bacillus paralicheniformis]
MPKLKPTTAAWLVRPPSSVMSADAFSSEAIMSRSVLEATNTAPSVIFCSASFAFFATTTGPNADLRPMPCPFAIMLPTVWTFIRFVVPDSPTEPAVMTIRSPRFTMPLSSDF